MKLVQTYKQLPPIFYAEVALNKVAAPHIVLWNERLARELQLPTSWQTNADYFAGNDMPEGASQIAQAYAGH
ncbi:MAG: hypothetical protein KIG60_08340, partial [Caryophanon sp.]|nr:hypothetical protein [Caryophanon sp.]